MQSADERVTEAMREVGFSAGEAKIYVALLQIQPATGYELAATSGVPRSAIYSLLHRLEKAGLINMVQDRPAKYVAMPPEQLFQQLKARFMGSLHSLRKGLEEIQEPVPKPALLWSIQGYEQMLDRAHTMIEEARNTVFAGLWGREAVTLRPALAAAQAAGRSVVLFSFTQLPEGAGRVLSYGFAEEELAAHWTRKLILVVDHERALLGSTEMSETDRGVLTDDPGIVDIALNNIVLDITLFGQRQGVDTADLVREIKPQLAPVDELLARSGKQGAAHLTVVRGERS